MDLYLVGLGILIGYFFAKRWINDKNIEWSQTMEIFVGISVLILLSWLIYNRMNHLDNELCIKIIIIFLAMNSSFHLLLSNNKFRKT